MGRCAAPGRHPPAAHPQPPEPWADTATLQPPTPAQRRCAGAQNADLGPRPLRRAVRSTTCRVRHVHLVRRIRPVLRAAKRPFMGQINTGVVSVTKNISSYDGRCQKQFLQIPSVPWKELRSKAVTHSPTVSQLFIFLSIHSKLL